MPFHEWTEKEGITPAVLNSNLRVPLLRARNRRKDIRINPYDVGVLSSTANYNLAPFGFEGTIATDGRMVLLMANLPAYTSLAGAAIYVDVYVPELDIYVSSGTPTQVNYWMGRMQYHNASHVNEIPMFYPWMPPITEEQELTFQLMIAVTGAGTWNIFTTFGYTMFGVMEA